jgi:DNA-binding winged helix-turn-helix (wHTH) protein
MMPRIEFEQAEVISAAGRAWHKGEPAIIQENGFPVASIVFTGESKNSFAGYGVILDFQITDSEGNNYAAQIGKELVATAAESQFPGDFTKAKVVEDPHNLIPAQLVDEEGVGMSLSTAEFDLLKVFLERPQRVLSRDQLLDLARGREAVAFDRAIDTLVSRLRRKLERDPKNPELIKTIWGGGYLFAADVTQE